MARPKKNNATYFPHDADMRNDPKIKAVRLRFGNDGYAVWCYLLESLTHASDFKIECDELNMELMAADFGVSTVEMFISMIDYFQKVRLIAIQDGFIFCAKLEERLSPVLDMRKRAKDAYKNRVNALESSRKDTKNDVSTDSSQVSTVETTQTKVNKSKVNKTIVLEEPKNENSNLKKRNTYENAVQMSDVLKAEIQSNEIYISTFESAANGMMKKFNAQFLDAYIMTFSSNYITKNSTVSISDITKAFVNSFNWVLDKVNDSQKQITKDSQPKNQNITQFLRDRDDAVRNRVKTKLI